MSFTEASPPSPDKIVVPGRNRLFVPSANFFRTELFFWQSKFKESDKAGDATGRRLSEDFKVGFRDAFLGRLVLECMPADIMTLPGSKEDVDSWYDSAVALTAISYLWRQLTGNKEAGFEFGFSDAEICSDFDTNEPRKVGIHFEETILQQLLGIDSPENGSSAWYEAESMYVQVYRPARPTRTMRENYADFYGKPFIPGEFTTVQPRLKREVWEA